MEDVIMICKWRNKIVPCFEIFREIETEEGICFTFNSLETAQISRKRNSESSNSFNFQEMYLSNKADLYPHRALGNGAESGLAIVVHQKYEDVDYVCRGPVQGVKVYIHNPRELPSNKNHIRVSLKKNIMISVKPQLVTAVDSLKAVDPKA